VTGCAAYSTADHPSPAPNPPVRNAPPIDLPAPRIPTPAPKPPIDRVPVLADGRYDAYIRRVEHPYEGGTSRLVVDLVQVFHDQAAVDAAVANGQSRDTAQVLSTYVRNQNPRLRTLPLAGDVRLNLRGGCEEPTSHQLAKLAGGAVQRVQELWPSTPAEQIKVAPQHS
jgi:hypothetical protein